MKIGDLVQSRFTGRERGLIIGFDMDGDPIIVLLDEPHLGHTEVWRAAVFEVI